MKCVTSYGLYTITARPRPPLVRPAAQLVRHVTSAPSRAPFRWSHQLGLTYPCKRLRCSALPITIYKRSHLEWVFTERNGEFTEKNQTQGGRGFDSAWRRRRRRIPPLRLFFANWPPSRLPYTCSLPYRAHGSVCTRCAAGCNRRVSVGRRVVRDTRLAGPCWA